MVKSKIGDESEQSETENIVEKSTNTRYKIFLVITALLGWTMVVYEWQFFSVMLGPISSLLRLTTAETSDMLSAIQFGLAAVVLIVGFSIDRIGRKIFYQISLLLTGILTGLTGFIAYIGVIPLIFTRIGAQGIAQLEQPTAASMISEEMPAKIRGLIYSLVQSGFDFGVAIAGLIAALLYPVFGLKYVWLIAVIPMILIVVARRWVKETTRFGKVRDAREGKVDKTVSEFTNVKKVKVNPYKQAFEANH